MSDAVGKVIGVILAAIMLLLAPLVIVTVTADMTMKRSVMNEMTNFLDIVCDTRTLTAEQMADFYLAVASHGAVADVTVRRDVKIVNPDGLGNTVVSYIPVEDSLSDTVVYARGDIITVTVTALDYTGAQRIMFQLMQFALSRFECTFSKMVR